MIAVKRIVLDVLKPHSPNALDFSKTIAEKGNVCQVTLIVTEIDEKTETLQIVVEGDSIDFDAVHEAITAMGGSLHSIDEVQVVSTPDTD